LIFSSTLFENILSPAILFFVLGFIIKAVKSDFDIPKSISRYLSIYLMIAIGFKGGVAINNNGAFHLKMLLSVFAGLTIGFLQPFLAYGLLRLRSKLDVQTAAALAAHYGSISIVTFATAASFLKSQNIEYSGYIIAILTLMEAPAIFSGLYLAGRYGTKNQTNTDHIKQHIFTNGPILLLLGSFFIGWITGNPGMQKVGGFLDTPFQGILCLFLLDMGLLVAKNLDHFSLFTKDLFFFGIYMPLIGGAIGLLTSYIIGLDIGTGTLFTVLCASASYIAVPAAMRLALPEAKAEIYVPMSLAITFPFNVTIGIPLYFLIAQMILRC
jgi:hypothetical protein